jgi:NDP-sugar pyrophosphorylase family protein
MKAVILAGGTGARLAPYTKILPKPLMPIGDMPILEIMLQQMKRVQDGELLGLKIRYSYEEQPLGTAGPLSLVEGLDDTFLVSNGDVMTTLDLCELVDFHRANGAIATIAAKARKVKIDLGVIECNPSNQVTGYIEKPTYEFFVSMGIYVFEPRVLAYIPHNQFLDFPDLVLQLIRAGEKVTSFPFTGYWQDLGRPDDYEQAVQDFEKMKPLLLRED